MPDSLKDTLLARNTPLLGGASAKIGAQPEPSGLRNVLEMLTGYPADNAREMGLVM